VGDKIVAYDPRTTRVRSKQIGAAIAHRFTLGSCPDLGATLGVQERHLLPKTLELSVVRHVKVSMT